MTIKQEDIVKKIYGALMLAMLFISGSTSLPIISNEATKNNVKKVDSFDWDALVDEEHSPFEEEMKQEIAHHKPPSWLIVKLREFGCFLLDTQEKIEKWWNKLKVWVRHQTRVAKITSIRR